MVVRMRHTRSQRGNQRSQKKLEKPAITRDQGSGGLALRHRVSPITGTYKGKKVIELSKDKESKKKASNQEESKKTNK